MIIGLFPVSFLMIIVSYALGYFFYFCYKKLKEDVLVNYEIMNQYEQEYLDYNEKILEKTMLLFMKQRITSPPKFKPHLYHF